MLHSYMRCQLLHQRGMQYCVGRQTRQRTNRRRLQRRQNCGFDPVGDLYREDDVLPGEEEAGSIDESSGPEGVRQLLMEMDIAKHDVGEVMQQAIDYWQERCPDRTTSFLCFDHVNSVLTYLVDTCMPVRYFSFSSATRMYKACIGYRELPSIIQRCPALLMCSVDDDLAPMIALFDELKIGRSSREHLCTSEPRVLLEGQRDVIRHVMTSLHQLGIHENQVPKLVGECPSMVLESIESFNHAMIHLSRLFATEEDLILFINSSPHLIHDSPQRFHEVHKVLQGVCMTEEEALQCVRREPKLLLKDPKKLKNVCDWFIESGLTPAETKSMLQSYPQLLIRRLSVLKEKKKFLVSVAGRPFRDVLSFPTYFHYAIDRTIGPRFTFLRERHDAALHEASLDSLMRPHNVDFATKVAKVIEAEYLVYQAQWTRMYGHKFDFLGRPRQHHDTH